MLKTLSELLDRHAAIAKRQEDLRQRLAKIRAQKDDLINAADPDDTKAFSKVGDMGWQENCLLVALEKCDREKKGLAASLLNESDHVRHTLASAGVVKRDAALQRISSALERFVPDAKARAKIVARVSDVAPEIRLLERRAIGTGNYTFDPHNSDEIGFARQVYSMAERAIAECGITH